MKKNLVCSSPLFVLLLLFSLWGSEGCKKSPEMKFSGTLEFTEHGVGPRVTGRLTSMTVEEGDEVKIGRLIATLERYDQAKRDYDRTQQLSQAGGASRQAVEQAGLTLEDQQILSPVEGVVLTKVHEAGEVVAAGSPVAVIGDREKIWVRVFIPEGLVSRIRMGQTAVLQFDGIARTFKGHVSFIAPKAEFTPRNVQTLEERVTQTFAVKIELDEREPYLRPGVTAEVTLDLSEKP
jgi:membrane fusion protein YbhG